MCEYLFARALSHSAMKSLRQSLGRPIELKGDVTEQDWLEAARLVGARSTTIWSTIRLLAYRVQLKYAIWRYGSSGFPQRSTISDEGVESCFDNWKTIVEWVAFSSYLHSDSMCVLFYREFPNDYMLLIKRRFVVANFSESA
jgi:hypothetical protein